MILSHYSEYIHDRVSNFFPILKSVFFVLFLFFRFLSPVLPRKKREEGNHKIGERKIGFSSNLLLFIAKFGEELSKYSDLQEILVKNHR